MTISVLKMHVRKLPPKIVNYRDFKKSDNKRFMNFLQYTLSEEEHVGYRKTQTVFMKFLIVFLIITYPDKWSVFVEISSLSWLKRIQELLYKEYVLEANF